MRTLLSKVIAWLCIQCIAAAAEPITFAPPLTPTWIVKTNREMPAIAGITGHIIVLQNSNQTLAVTVTFIRCTQSQIAKGFERNARNHLGGSLDGWINNPKAKVTDEKFIIKKTEDREVAEASCRIKSPGQTLYFYGNCWLSKTNLVSCTAFGKKSRMKDDKGLQALVASIKVTE